VRCGLLKLGPATAVSRGRADSIGLRLLVLGALSFGSRHAAGVCARARVCAYVCVVGGISGVCQLIVDAATRCVCGSVSQGEMWGGEGEGAGVGRRYLVVAEQEDEGVWRQLADSLSSATLPMARPMAIDQIPMNHTNEPLLIMMQ